MLSRLLHHKLKTFLILLLILVLGCVVFIFSMPRGTTATYIVVDNPTGGLCTTNVPPSACSKTITVRSSDGETLQYQLSFNSPEESERYNELSSILDLAIARNQKVELTTDENEITRVKLVD